MMKLTVLSLMAASVAAFSVLPEQSTTSSNTALFYYRAGTRFDLVGGSQREQILAQKVGKANLQGGSDVGWSQLADECDVSGDVNDPNCYYIEPYHDVMATQGSWINSDVIGPSKVQGGSDNDWVHPGGSTAPYYQKSFGAAERAPEQAASPQGVSAGSGTGSYLDNL